MGSFNNFLGPKLLCKKNEKENMSTFTNLQNTEEEVRWDRNSDTLSRSSHNKELEKFEFEKIFQSHAMTVWYKGCSS